jgi:hypothetical protein
MPTRLTEGEKTLIRVLYTEKQKNTQQIAEMMDRPIKTVQKQVRLMGIRRQDEVFGFGGKVYKRLTSEQEQSICDAIRNGELPSDVARDHNMPKGRIRGVLRRHNVKGPIQTLGYSCDRAFTPDEDQEIRRRVEAGESRKAIAKEYGVGTSTVTDACTRAGMPPGESTWERGKRNKACERLAVRSTLTIEQTAQALNCTEKLVRQARIRHAKNPGPIKSPDADEQKILNSLVVDPHILTGLYGGVQSTKPRRGRPPGKRPVIVSDLPPTVSEQIVRLRKEGKLVNEIAAILKIDPAEVRTALQSQWSR